MPVTDPVPLRVYSEADGKVYLLREPQNWRVEVATPVTEQSLETALFELGAIANKVGFAHAEYMSVLFREAVGMTPGQYRKEHGERNM